MTPGRSRLVLVLLAVPVVAMTVAGAFALYQSGWLFWTWWILPLCWGAAYLLTRRERSILLAALRGKKSPPGYWTDRDKRAWDVVQHAADEARSLPAEALIDPDRYMKAAERLLLDVTRVYHPNEQDPIGSITVPELLAAAQLAIEDIADLVRLYVPGSRFMTVKRWRMLTEVPKWYQRASNLMYFVSAVFGPVSTASRFFVSRLVLGPAMQLMQENVLLWFYASFINRVGLYAIELNSGRLSVGAKRWREATIKAMEESGTAEAVPTKPPESAERLTIALIGQVNAGKSSLVNALLGQSTAAMDALPTTKLATRYELHDDEWLESLTLIDTVGYGERPETKNEIREMAELLRDADIVLLVMDAMAAARAPDQRVIDRMDKWFAEHPQFRRPPIIGVLTHVDSLSPVMEWNPPYDWQESEPSTPKAASIRAAVEHVTQGLADHHVEVYPVCTDILHHRVYGIDEWLVPAIIGRLSDARAVMMLRAIHRESNTQHLRTLLNQLKNASSTLLRKAVGA